tara:strand:+ start:89 stop:304 length:216 start_codon:yes stop_codon:yes gene_type:complete
MEYLGIEGYLGYLLMMCIVSFVLILCTILSLQDKRIKRYKLSEITKDRIPKPKKGVWDMQSTVKYTKGDNT